MKKVLLVDDHPLILSALKSLIETLHPGAAVTALGSAAELRACLAEDEDHDLLLLDLQLGDVRGFELLIELREQHPALPVVVVSGTDRNADILHCIDLGAMGFVPKRASTAQLTEALRMVVQGGIYVPPMSQDQAAASAAAGLAGTAGDAADGSGRAASLAELGLTPRQTDVLGLLLQGKPNKVIARELGLSVETIKDHVAAVLRALGVHSRTQAVLAVGQMSRQGGGLLPELPGLRRPASAPAPAEPDAAPPEAEPRPAA